MNDLGGIFHIGAHGAKNAGDTVILDCITKLFPGYDFTRRQDFLEFDKTALEEANKAALVLIGGGGLFIKDTMANSISGWRFRCSPELLERIESPIAVFGIGYNRFRNQDDFIPAFSRQVSVLVEKSTFFGMRSRDANILMSNYLEPGLVEKIAYQPCPAEFAGLLFDIERKPDKKVIFAPGMDRMDKRFAGREREIFSEIAKILKTFEKAGFDIRIALHLSSDEKALDLLGGGFRAVHLSCETTERILDFYSSARLVLGMRLHSIIIPFSLGIPFLGISSHDKIGRFCADAGHPEWCIEALDENLSMEIFDKSLFDPQTRESEILDARRDHWNITQANLEKISEAVHAFA